MERGTAATRSDVRDEKLLADQFLALVSHELRTPLNAIFGWVRLLRTGGLSPDEAEKALETIERHARIQTQLVEDLLDVSRISSGKLRMDPRPLHPADVVRAAVEVVQLTADAKGVTLVAAIAPEPCRLTGDPNRLEQVVWNLLSNAIKFTPRGGRVEVALRIEGGLAVIEVTDTGHGIEPDFLPFVFDRFRQADSSTRRQQGGLGLGLAIVRHIVEAHGGAVEVDSPGYGQGARFTVFLPLDPVGEPVPAPAPREAPRRDPGDGLRDLSVVVVDDDDDARVLIAKVLEGAVRRVTTCASATLAFEEVRARPPDVLVSDIGMPGQNGYDLIRRVRALPDGGRLIAIALTGFARREDSAEAARAGFDAHLAKPVDPSHLRETIYQLAAAQKLP